MDAGYGFRRNIREPFSVSYSPGTRPLLHRHKLQLLSLLLLVSVGGCTAQPETSADWRRLDARHFYDGNDLGCIYDPATETATLSLWAPTAQKVSVTLFTAGDASEVVATMPMTREHSVWRIHLRAGRLGIRSLRGIFYQYEVDGRPALDPYASSMAISSGAADGTTGKAAIVDMDNVRVSDFARVSGYEKREDAIIYEVHVRDFTVDPAIEHRLGDQPFGTYTAFIEMLPYLMDLGVTHIQLLPVMAYLYGDESLRQEREWAWVPGEANYNWGYDPHSYFAPEGMYATDPNDPQTRVDELKRLIEAIHASGMAVILDVVYNHHPSADLLDPIVPGYYYRGRNDSLAGTDIATERSMARKLIVDSLTYWTREYKIDGFRFDLMGLMDRDTIRASYKAVSRINPDTLFIGEGWRMYQGPPLPVADQDWSTQQDFAAVFSDEYRDLVKSGYQDEGTPRFISGGREKIAQLFANIKGQPHVYMKTDDPGDVVQYVAAHDNLTLHDVIALATGLDPDRPEEELEIQKRQRLANALLLTSQGIVFLHAGQEYGRSKRWQGETPPPDSHSTRTGATFVHNSYDSPDIVNYFDWARVAGDGPAGDTRRYTRGLIRLRRSTDAFRLGTEAKVNDSVSLIQSQDIAATDNVIAYTATATDGARFHTFINADHESRSIAVDLDLTTADLLADAARAGTTGIDEPVGVMVHPDRVELAPLTAAIFRDR